MATLTTNRAIDFTAIDFHSFVPDSYSTGPMSFYASRQFFNESGGFEQYDNYRGINLTYSGSGYPTGGTITDFSQGLYDIIGFDFSERVLLSGFSASAATLRQVALSADKADDVAFFRTFLGGDDELQGSRFADTIDGAYGNDRLFGRAGNDVLSGGSGNDTIDGGDGADSMAGGTGNDTFCVSNAADTVAEYSNGGSNDTVLTVVNYGLAANAYVETLATFSATSTTAIALTGNAFGQTVRGGGGANTIDGGAGIDTLTGLGGRDTFVFSAALGATNADKITDFAPADDTIALSQAIFSRLTATGPIATEAFKNIATGTVDASDRILYDQSTGILSYDRDGSGSDYAPIRFASLSNHADLTAADFIVI